MGTCRTVGKTRSRQHVTSMGIGSLSKEQAVLVGLFALIQPPQKQTLVSTQHRLCGCLLFFFKL